MWLRQAVGRISRKDSRRGEDDLNAHLKGTPIAKIAQGKSPFRAKSSEVGGKQR
jgi:hypothetical protein